MLGANDKIRDVSWYPQSALFAGKKVRSAARESVGPATFAEFVKPAAAAAADLVRGERVILEDGSGSLAALATSAIPGLLPPVSLDDKILVDGSLVSRIPLDLLERRRCGLKIGVNVVPSPQEKTSRLDREQERLTKEFGRLFGLGSVLASSWGLLAWWQGATDASGADIFLEPQKDARSGFDFDAFDHMVAAGRRATEQKLEAIRRSVAALLRPGTP